MDFLYQIDIAVLRWINTTATHPILDYVLSLIADTDTMIWLLAPTVIAVAVWGGFKGRVFLVLMILCLLIGDAGINWAIKTTVNRPRPHQTLENVRRVKLTSPTTYRVQWSEPGPVKNGRSMTSGHTCNNVALALLLTLLYGRWGALAWIWAAAMGYSRIYSGDHYPSDVLVSALVACAYTGLICCAACWLWHKGAPRLLPKTYARHPHLLH
ncbi:MAG: phosphatase PAP2 family protein [Candidatus Methylacidiphilales bacterium]|nr:phosphatase PAP2 family protein [Candidatus Methylacidiphilales bacterium]